MGRLSEFSAEEADYFRGTSALEATLLQQALDRQRSDIANHLEELSYLKLAEHQPEIASALTAIAASIRRGDL